MKIDQLDREIVKLLARDARMSGEKIARKLKTTPGTVRRRLHELLKNKVLHIVGVIDPVKFGYVLSAFIGFDVEHDKLNSALNNLTSRPEVSWISTTTGRFDLVCLVSLGSTQQLADFIEEVMAQIEGLRNCETFVCLRTTKPKWSFPLTDDNADRDS